MLFIRQMTDGKAKKELIRACDTERILKDLQAKPQIPIPFRKQKNYF